MKVSFYCICGGALNGKVPEHKHPELLRCWRMMHSGPGHSDCDAQAAARARAKNERQTIKDHEQGRS